MEFLEITLFSKSIEKQRTFYHHLGFEITANDKGFSVQAGKTQLTFEARLEEENFYHFAFLICESHFSDTLNFIKQKGINILPDRETGEKITYWASGIGKSFYFLDENGNILEFVVRPTLNYRSDEKWSIDKILKINEIGTPVNKPADTSHSLIDKYRLNIPQRYIDRFNDDFCWFGDFEGTILIVKESRAWYPTKIKAKTCDLRIKISDQQKIIDLKFNKGKFEHALAPN